MKLAHLSDLHFGRHDEAVSSTLARELAAQELDVIVISGDFTQHGIESEFKAAREFLDTLETPVLAVPGNHDFPQANLWKRLLNPYALYRKYIADEMEPFAEIEGVALAGLKTAHRIMPGFNWTHGSLSRRQLAELEVRFSKASPDALRVVIAHHPLLYPEGVEKMRQERAWRADLALETFATLGVRLVLSGHFHLSYVRTHEHAGSVGEGEPTGLRKSAVAPTLVAQTSSTLSTRLRGHPNAYNLIDITDGEVTIKVREWGPTGWMIREKQTEPTPEA